MSVWAKIIYRELEKIRTLHYTKLNVIQQEIADLFQKNKLSTIEVQLILEGMENRVMLNEEKAEMLYRKKNAVLIEYEKEGLEQLRE